MKNKGWVKLWRKQFDNWISEEPFCSGYAWCYLYSQANHKKGAVNFRNEYIEIERGQFLTSKLKLQKIFGWTRQRVAGLLLALENSEMITYRTTNRYTVITIVNYDLYQGSEEENDIQNDKQVTNRLLTGLKRGTINKNDKNVKNEKKKSKKISFNFIKKEFTNLTKEKMEEFNEKYPGVDIDQEIERMEDWLVGEKEKRDNSEKNKIPKDYSRFMNNWLRNEEKESESNNEELPESHYVDLRKELDL